MSSFDDGVRSGLRLALSSVRLEAVSPPTLGNPGAEDAANRAADRVERELEDWVRYAKGEEVK